MHVAVLLMMLSAYAIWSLWSSFGRGPRLQIFAGLFASAAVFGVVTRQRWTRPVVYSLGVLMILEWLGYTIEALRSGYPFRIRHGSALRWRLFPGFYWSQRSDTAASL